MSILESRLEHGVLVSDGAMGSLLVEMGADPSGHLDHLNITAPDMVEGIHRQYVQAGADIVITNTFQSSRARLEECGLTEQLAAINEAGVRIARRSGASLVFASVGPTGLLIDPLGEASLDDAYRVLAEQVEALAEAGPDAILIETQGDIQEARAAVLAATECCDIPVVVTMTFGQDGRTNLSGTPPEAAALLLSRLGTTAVGANCGLGPEAMSEVVAKMPAYSAVPVMCQPNAGVPRLEDGKTVYPGSPDASADYAVKMVEQGVSIVGSCCGSTPAYTAAIAAAASHLTPGERVPVDGLVVSSRAAVVHVGAGRPTVLIGERLNPTGRKAIADALRGGDFAAYREAGIAQAKAGAALLDVNVGLPGVDEAESLDKAARIVADAVSVPLVLDSTAPDALERALRRYPGRALVNSVNGSEESLDAVLPLVARYGAAAIIMPLDEQGIPDDAAGRLAIGERVLARAAEHGLKPSDFLLDGVVMAAAAGEDAARPTLETVAHAREALGVGTVLGVSNISHGLPDRPALNQAFLGQALQAGADAVMFDVLRGDRESDPVHVAAAEDLLDGRISAAEYVSRTAVAVGVSDSMTATDRVNVELSEPLTATDRIARVVEDGDIDAAEDAAEAVLAEGADPVAVISDVLTPAIQKVGDAFASGDAFLPQVMMSADAMKRAVARLKQDVPVDAAPDRGTVVLATVAGDIHSIGKEIVANLLESQGFRVVDLGVDVQADAIVEAAGTERAVVVGLSALMTTTLPAMSDTVAALKASGDAAVVVGGAVLTPEWADSVGAEYAADAIAAVDVVARLADADRRDSD